MGYGAVIWKRVGIVRIGSIAGRLVVLFAGTLTSSVPILRSAHICCFHFFFEKVKGAQIFPAVILAPAELGGDLLCRFSQDSFYGGERGYGG